MTSLAPGPLKKAMPLALRSLSRPRPAPLSWPPPAPLPSIARLGRARSNTTTTTTSGRIVSMVDKGEAKLSSLASVRANFALKAMDGDSVLSVDHHDEIVDAGDEFRQRALVASRAQVRRHIAQLRWGFQFASVVSGGWLAFSPSLA